jgi:DNA excision repair protein ERCC-4
VQVIIDTREQRPLKYPGSVRKTLNVGDYSSVRLFGKFAIERKSPNDLYGTLLKGHKRFRKAIKRAIEKKIHLVVFVECTKKNFLAKKYDGAEFQPYPTTVIEKIMATMHKRYGIVFVWCKDRAVMQKRVLRRLQEEEKKLKQK